MHQYIETLHTWLSEQYAAIKVPASDTEATEGWHWHTTDNSPKAAELLDHQLGIWTKFRVLPEDEEQIGPAVQADVSDALDSVSRLEIRSGIADSDCDEQGAWQVHLIWIASPKSYSSWQEAIRDLRARSGHAEELNLDVITFGKSGLRSSLDATGLPTLLFKARALLQLDVSELPAWQSPDAVFAQALRDLPNKFTESSSKEFARQFVDEQLGLPHSSSPTQGIPVRALDTLRIANFKNIINAEISFDSAPCRDKVLIIHGPNGTGKSSLFEALSLTLFGSSMRLKKMLKDTDDLKAPLRADPSNKLLRRFESREPMQLSMGGQNCLNQIAKTFDEASTRHDLSRGTMLSQEEARDYMDMTSQELAALVLRDYSVLAGHVKEAVDRGEEVSKQNWQDWLRSLGINAAITQRKTIQARLIANALNEHFPPAPQSRRDWVQRLAERFSDFGPACHAAELEWSRLDSHAAREMLTDSLAVALNAGVAEEVLLDWLKDRDHAHHHFDDLASKAEHVLSPLRVAWPGVEMDVKLFASWVAQQGSVPPNPMSTESTRVVLPNPDLVANETRLRSELTLLAKRGDLLRAHREHLDTLQAGLLPKWQEVDPTHCPTCQALHHEGIASVVATLLASVTAQHSDARSRYATLSVELKRVQTQLGSKDKPPLTTERLSEIDALLGYPNKAQLSVEADLRASRGDWGAVLRPFELLLAPAPRSKTLDDEARLTHARAAVEGVIAKVNDGLLKRDQPEKWQELRKAIDALIKDLVDEHLPRTLGAVWYEIAQALAPARWNHAAEVNLKQQPPQRGHQRLGFTLTIDGADTVPARHILNQAEQHVLGMAWFLTRHLSHGRFVVPLLAMDDPAQEMDQATYRRFVRFLQALVRVHRVTSKPLDMLVLLHQEDRALDLARAATTLGTLTLLEWSKEMVWHGPTSTVRQIQLRNPEQRAPHATVQVNTSPPSKSVVS